MSVDQHATGLAIIRVPLGVFFVFESLSKIRWLTNTSLLAGQLARWLQTVGSGSSSGWYLQHIAIPGAPLFARFVPLGEFCSGLALIVHIGARRTLRTQGTENRPDSCPSVPSAPAAYNVNVTLANPSSPASR